MTSKKTVDPDKLRDRRGVRLAVAGVVVLLGGLYVGGHFLIGDRLPVGMKIAGVGVGGLHPDKAEAKLDKGLASRVDDPIELVSGEQEFKVKPKDAGLEVDVPGSVQNAGGGATWSPVRMMRVLIGNEDVAPALDVDETALKVSVAKIGETLDKTEVEPQITFAKNKPDVREPADGRLVHRPKTAALIRDRYLVERGAAKVPVTTVKPRIDAEETDRVLEEFAEPAMSGPVIIKVGAKQVELLVADFASSLVVQAQNGELVPTVDPKKLAGPLEKATDHTKGLGAKAEDATVELRGGEPVVVPAKAGIGIDVEQVAEALVPVLDKTGAQRSFAIDAEKVQAKFSTKQAKALGIKERVGTFSTRYPHADYRNVNQSRAANLIDGTVLKPGETFSFNDTVGERTAANGFTAGSIIADGQFREELGGGVSQVVTTTYNAGFFAGLEDVEHTPHSFYIDRYPVGREATVAWGAVDLKIKNDTEYGVLISANVAKSAPGRQGVTTVSMWSTKTWDIKADVGPKHNRRSPGLRYDASDRCLPQSGVTGFDIDVYRTFIRDGKRVKRETIPASYNAADTVRCQAKPKKKKSGD